MYKKRPIARLTPHQLSSRLCYLRKRRQTLVDAEASADVLAEVDRRIAELAAIPVTVRRRDLQARIDALDAATVAK